MHLNATPTSERRPATGTSFVCDYGTGIGPGQCRLDGDGSSSHAGAMSVTVMRKTVQR